MHTMKRLKKTLRIYAGLISKVFLLHRASLQKLGEVAIFSNAQFKKITGIQGHEENMAQLKKKNKSIENISEEKGIRFI